jgi:hypothetical protein
MEVGRGLAPPAFTLTLLQRDLRGPGPDTNFDLGSALCRVTRFTGQYLPDLSRW